MSKAADLIFTKAVDLLKRYTEVCRLTLLCHRINEKQIKKDCLKLMNHNWLMDVKQFLSPHRSQNVCQREIIVDCWRYTYSYKILKWLVNQPVNVKVVARQYFRF